MTEIRNFKNEYAFLSNFYITNIIYDSISYTNTEAAFQAQKTFSMDCRKQFTNLMPNEAKRLGRTIKLRSDWESVKVNIMYEIIKAKFMQNPELSQKLIKTGDSILIEGNDWGDRFWGVCPLNGIIGIDGQNNLGKILMVVREELKNQ